MTDTELTAATEYMGALRDDLEVVPQADEQRPRVLIRNPTTGRIYLFPEVSYKILCQLGPEVSVRQAVGNVIGHDVTGHGEVPQALLLSTTKLIAEARRAGLLVLPGEKERPSEEKQSLEQSLVAASERFNPLFIKLNLFNPQRAKKALDP